MKKPTISKVALFFSLVISVAMTPNLADARGSVQIAVPGVSISVNNGFSTNRYYNTRTYNYLPSSSLRNRNLPISSRTVVPSYRSSYGSSYYCPTPGYSASFIQNRGCYQHGSHFHCN